MTTNEVFNEYKKRFILLMEAAGEETNNDIYRDTEKILDEKKNRDLIQATIDNEYPFPIFVCILIVMLLEKIHGLDKLKDMSPEETYELSNYIFMHYLKKATRKFTTTYGLAPMTELDTMFQVRKILRKDKE